MRLIACVGVLAIAGPAVAGPIGFSYSARPVFRDGHPFLNADGRVVTPDGSTEFVTASIGPPTGHFGPGTVASGAIPLLSLPTDGFELGRPGAPGSGIFRAEVRVVEWAGSREEWFEFAAYGEVLFADNDPARGRLHLSHIGAGNERFATAQNAYEFQLVSRTADGVTRIDAEYTVTPLDGSPPVAATPEPTTLVSAALGLTGVVGFGWRRRKKG